MKNLKKGTRVRSIYGEILTVLEVRGNSVRVYEDCNNWIHKSKVYPTSNKHLQPR